MRNIISLIIGVFALILAVIAFLPLLGWGYWLIVPVALIGLAFGATSDRKSGRNLNIVVIVIGIIRLVIGGGLF